jgi:hypothetical protein
MEDQTDKSEFELLLLGLLFLAVSQNQHQIIPSRELIKRRK